MDGPRVDEVTVVHVDDDPDILSLASEVIERESPAISVETTTDPDVVLERLDEDPTVDCIVSDYQMCERNGLDLLADVQAHDHDVPFVLFTGKGSEEIASEAISAGVTDYLQKESGIDQYAVLANRIEHAVAQRRAQAEVEDTKRRYQTLIRESSDVIVVANPDGEVRYASSAVERVLGYEAEELEGGPLLEHVHPEDQDRAEAVFADLVEDPSLEPTVELCFQHGDGSLIDLEAEGRNLLDDDVIGGIVVYGRDVSDRAERQAELERYEQIVEIAGDGAYMLDEDGHYEMVNQKTVDRTGYEEAELVGTPGTIVFDEDDVQKARDATLEVFRNDDKEYAQFEATVHGRDGTAYPVEIRTAPIVEDGKIVGSVGTSRDIAERKQRERELERYELIVETAGDAANVLDEDGRYVMVNDALLEHTGYEREELIGSHARELIDDADYERAREALYEVYEADDRDFVELELTVETADGDRYPAEIRMAPIVEDGHFQGSVGTIREITERKRRERELKRQNERLGKFATVVSHDLRSPLTVADARIELAQDGDLDHLDVARDAIQRMERLIDDVLTLAQEGRMVEDPMPMDVESVAREAWSSVATGDATLEVEDSVTLEGDRSRVCQVFENLFRNAVEHGSGTPPLSAADDAAAGGAATTSSSAAATAVDADDSHVTVTVGALPDGGFYVADDGVGLQGADPERIFDANVTTKADGTGLGLAIVHDILEAHGWEIRLVQGTAEGLRFDVETTPTAEELVTG